MLRGVEDEITRADRRAVLNYESDGRRCDGHKEGILHPLIRTTVGFSSGF